MITFSHQGKDHMGLALFSLHQSEAIHLLQQAAILTKVKRPNSIIKENKLVWQ